MIFMSKGRATGNNSRRAAQGDGIFPVDTVRKRIAKMSWTIRMPIETRAWTAALSPRSSNVFDEERRS
jgi:hypothetical protein